MGDKSRSRIVGPETVATTVAAVAGLVLAAIYLFDGRFSWQDVLAVVVLLAAAAGWLGGALIRRHAEDE
jgi:type III secretory pathway component EscS